MFGDHEQNGLLDPGVEAHEKSALFMVSAGSSGQGRAINTSDDRRLPQGVIVGMVRPFRPNEVSLRPPLVSRRH